MAANQGLRIPSLSHLHNRVSARPIQDSLVSLLNFSHYSHDPEPKPPLNRS